MSPTIRRWTTNDSIPEITAMLHRAYEELAAMGFHYVATDQEDATTLRRLSQGEAWVAERNGRIVGTITVLPPGVAKGCVWYETPGVAMFTQFAVDPAYRRQGIGTALLETIEQSARRMGAKHLACDTADEAAHLIEMYNHFGYEIVDTADWEMTNYQSVILSKTFPLTD